MSLEKMIEENVTGNTELQETKPKPRKEYQRVKIQYSYFCMILYPEEDNRHKLILEELKHNKTVFPKLMYINHDRDIYTEDTEDAFGIIHVKGELKKPHTHVLFKIQKKSTPNGIIKHFDGLVSKVEGVENEYAYATYLTHENAVSIAKGKPIYSREEIKGDRQFILDLFIQNTNSVQFYEVLKIVKQHNNIFSVFEELHDNEEEKLFEICKKHAHLFILAQNQIINNYKNFPTAKAGETVRSVGYYDNSPHVESRTEASRREEMSQEETKDEALKKSRPPPKNNIIYNIRYVKIVAGFSRLAVDLCVNHCTPQIHRQSPTATQISYNMIDVVNIRSLCVNNCTPQ